MASDDNTVDRRKLLKAIGATGAAAGLAGCGGGGGGGGDTTTTTTSTTTSTTTTSTTTEGPGGGTTDTTDTTDTTTQQANKDLWQDAADSWLTTGGAPTDPTVLQWNPFNGSNQGPRYKMEMDWTQFNKGSSKFENRLMEDISFGPQDKVVQMSIDPEYKWVGGGPGNWSVKGPVKAEDVILDLWMSKLFDAPLIKNQLSGFRKVDDMTIELTRSKEGAKFNNRIFKQRGLENTQDVNRFNWADIVAKLRELSNDGKNTNNDAYQKYLTNNVTEKRMGIDEIYVGGRWLYMGNRAKKAIDWKLNPHYPRHDWTDIQRLRENKTHAGGREQQFKALQKDNSDIGAVPLAPSVAKQLPEHWQRVQTEGIGGGGTWFNLDHDWLGLDEVRQAVRFAVDNREVVRNQNRTPIDPVVTGMSNATIESNWVGDILGQFTNYKGKQVDRAASLMREAGAEKNSKGHWADSTGESITVNLKAIAGWTGAMIMNRTIASHMQEFGFDAKAVGIEWSQFMSDHWTEDTSGRIGKAAAGAMKDFDMLKWPLFGEFGVWHPVEYYAFYYWGGVAKYKNGAYNEKFDVPSTIGDPDSPPTRVNFTKLTDQLIKTSDLQKQKELVERLAWGFNQTVPVFGNNKPGGEWWLSTDDWDIPAVPDAFNPPQPLNAWRIREWVPRGTIQYKFPNKDVQKHYNDNAQGGETVGQRPDWPNSQS